MNVLFAVCVLVFFVKIVECLYKAEIVNEREFPCQVSLSYYHRDWKGKLKGHAMCGASLINSNTILTTAHCLLEDNDRIEIQAGTDIVLDLESGIKATVIRKIIPDEYDYPHVTLNYDIGLGILDRNISESELVRYCDIDPTYMVPMNVTGFLSGWGLLELKVDNEEYQLRKITMRVISDLYCNGTAENTEYPFDEYSKIQHLCGGSDVSEACAGDSGGGFVRLLDGKKSKRWSVFGIAAFPGIETEYVWDAVNSGLCGIGFYTGFTRVGPYLDWIWSHVEKPGPPPSHLGPLKYIDYLGEDLERTCFGYKDGEDKDVCSRHGECVYLDTCECDRVGRRKYFGERCEESRELTNEEIAKEIEEEEERKRKEELNWERILKPRIGDRYGNEKMEILGVVVVVLFVLMLICKIFCKT